MFKTLPFPRQRAVGLAAVASTLALMLTPTLANADTSSTLTVVGTSDASDSGLIPNVIQPGFNKAFPQFTFKYVGSATGAAIQNAENGTGGPSALIVHAAALENQFVANGFSYKNQFGNAIFTNDFVLAGPTGDPAGAAGNAADNIAQAFADVASAGAGGHATFFTRGGTSTASGTTVEEHQIWALVHSSGLQPGSLSLCVVSAADGGGMSPVKSAALNGQPCPDSGTVQSPDNPSWYFINAGSNQAANVIAANACPPADAPSGSNTCYVLTDRGTFDYLASGTDPAGSIPNLKIVTRGPQSASAPGGVNALTNYFHVYIINPSKPGETVNLTAAEDLVDYLTSPAFQSQLKSYLAKTSDPAGAPFVADASPLVTAHGIPHVYRGGKPAAVTGTVTNAEPGYPTPANATVNVDEIRGALLIPVASGKTNSSGHYSIRFVPPSSGSYEVSTGQISMIENPSLNPAYGDILSPGATAPVKVSVRAVSPSLHATSQGGKALVFGTVEPGAGHGAGTVAVLARKLGSKGSFRTVAAGPIGAAQGNFAVSAPLRKGSWQVAVRFFYAGHLVVSEAHTVNVSIGAAPSSAVTFRSVRPKHRQLVISASVAPSAPAGAKLVVLGVDTAPGAPAILQVLGHVTLTTGQTSVTLGVKVKRKDQWLVQVAYVQPGQSSSFSRLRAAAVR
ncbi:MAG: substrate-binding domain-containing protein [Solirubrobacterales bacterium]|nr:substrate-binding domain-containing protein [Solirubrobacterales bacterium]